MGRQLLAYADLPVTIDVSWAFAPIGQIEGFVPGGVEVGEKIGTQPLNSMHLLYGALNILVQSLLPCIMHNP